MSAPIIGIDLGTCNSVVASADAGGNVRVLADEAGFKVQPSVVSFHPSGTVIVGAEAKQRRIIDPGNTVHSVKRLIGRAYRTPEVAEVQQRVPYVIREGANQQPLIVTRAGELTVPEISAMVLNHMRRIAEAQLGVPVERVVITVPANFTDAQRQATATAGAIAGLQVPRVLSEPTAAALAYGHHRPLDQTIAVYDFGGGTFDITVLRLRKDVYEVLGTAGDSFLGGNDIDERVVDTMVQLFLQQQRIDLRGDYTAMQRLREVAEQTKIELARRTRALVKVEEIAYGNGGAKLDLELEMTRESLVGHAADIVERTFPVCEEALRLAGLTARGVDDVVLVGGTTKMPYVRERVGQFFGKAPRTDISPDEAIAAGAALQALALSRILGSASRRTRSADSGSGSAAAAARPAPGGPGARDFVLEERTDVGRPLAARGAQAPARGAPVATQPGVGAPRPPGAPGKPPRPPGKPPRPPGKPPGPPGAKPGPPEGRPARALSSAATHELSLGPTAKWPRASTQAPNDIELPQPQGDWPRPDSEITVEVDLPEPTGAGQRPRRDPSPVDLPPAQDQRGQQPEPAAQEPSQRSAYDSGALTIDQERDFVAELGLELPDLPPGGGPEAQGHNQPPPSLGQPLAPPQRADAPLPAPVASRRPASAAPAIAEALAVPAVPVVLDVLPHSLGIGTVGGYCEELVRRNTRVPTAVARVFSTSKDEQRTVRIRVSQGESRRLGDNIVLGDLVLDGLEPRPRGQTEIEVTFDIDASGIVRVRATDRLTGMAQQADLQLTGAPTAEEVEASADRVRRLTSKST